MLVALLPLAASEIGDVNKKDFSRDIKPLLESYCYPCHSSKKTKGDLDLKRNGDTRAIQLNAEAWLG
ncbi:MAG TPA: hypothetical protein VHX44_12585, partial [Planctomycetota bacterium]|nr:hypothetical protein [Planctomycetota bacterium]